MALKILHTGDWHIGSYPGPETNGENARYHDVLHCLNRLVETAAKEKPGITIISGDIFHQARVWSDRGLKESRAAIQIIRSLSQIAPVVVLRGTPNHDSEQQFEMLKTAFSGDDSVSIITQPELLTVYTYDGQPVQVAGIPGFDRGEYRAKHPGLSREEETQVFTDLLADIVMGLKAQCASGLPSILSTHYTVPGCNMESGQTALFAQFEPVIYPDTLWAADFDLVALGHIHRPQQICEAQNAFYCGSITGLNFNDEGQKRGFYIHEYDNTGDGFTRTSSRFVETPYRKFETIRMTQTDIEAINAGAIDEVAQNLWGWRTKPEATMAGSIVRVLYTCSDAVNKAFNKALLEKRLYDDGAFWVQEITPEEITASVNRDELTGDNSPEENLASYLAEKGKEPADAERLLTLARPIVSEALEKNRLEAPSGVFTPQEIEVHNYRNYRDERFSYEGISFATINGENGAGKSSLFMDAMLDALYEEPREGDLTGWICNAEDARSGSIKFTFRLGEKTYRVTRTRQKSGKATLNLAELVEGEWQDRSAERYKDTQAIIEQTIGMDSLTLKATGLIMQDQYGLFLTADKTDRMAILGSILGLGVYSSMESMAADRATTANRELRRVQAAATEIAGAMPDVEAIKSDMESGKAIRSETEKELARRKEAADNIRFRLRVASEAGERANKLAIEIQDTANKLSASTMAQEAQRRLIEQAGAVLAQEQAILDAVAEYGTLEDEEKQLLGTVALYQAKKAEGDRVAAALSETRRKSARLTAERQAASESRWSYEQAIVGMDELEKQVAGHDEAQARLAELQEKWRAAETEYERAALAVSEEISKYSSGKGLKEAAIAELKSKTAMLENSGCTAENPSCIFLQTAIEAKAALPGKEAELAEYCQQEEKLIADLTERRDTLLRDLQESGYKEAVEEQKKAVSDIVAAAKRLADMTGQKERLTALLAWIEAIKSELEELATTITGYEAQAAEIAPELARIAVATQRHTEIRSRMAELEPYIAQEKELPAARQKKEAAETRLKELAGEYAELAVRLHTKQEERKKETEAATNTVQMEAELAVAEMAMRECESKLKALDEEMGGFAQKIADAEKSQTRIDELTQQAQQQGQLAADYEELKRAFSQDGIPHNIVRSMVPLFEATATSILGQMSGGHMSVELRMEKTLKSNSKKEVTALDIIINDANTGALPYMSRSGGERVKAALSVILALSEIKSSTAGVQLGFLFIDEPPFLDDKGVQAYCDALEAIQRRYSALKIMAITHDPEMKARFPQSVDVIKTEEGSKVIYA